MSSRTSRRRRSAGCFAARPPILPSTRSPARLQGTLDSIAPGSGQVFALLPPENATGNFTKIVQRVPVKIVLDDHNLTGLLRPGMSAEPTVNTKATVLAERETRARLASDAALVRPNGG